MTLAKTERRGSQVDSHSRSILETGQSERGKLIDVISARDPLWMIYARELPKNPGPSSSVPAPFGGPPPKMEMTGGRPPEDVLKLNAWLKDYAACENATYVDYFGALVDEKGWLRDGYSGDGLHPNAKGYKLMAPLVEAAIEKVLQ